MNRLLGVELRRFASRTLLWVVALGLVAVAAFGAFTAWEASRPPSAAQEAALRADFDRAVAEWEENGDQWLAECRESEEAERAAQEDLPAEERVEIDYGCDQMAVPRWEDWGGSPSSFAFTFPGSFVQQATLYLLAALVMATSFVAAEFSTGAMGNWLTFAPRRGQVFTSKVLGATLGVLPSAAVALAVTIGASWFAYSLNGALGEVTGEVWTEIASIALRVLALSAVAAVIGASLAFVLRHTAAVLGAVIAWAVVVEGIVANGLVQALRPYSLILAIQAWVAGGTTYWRQVCTRDARGGQSCEGIEETVSMAQGAIEIGIVALLLVLVAALVFRRRDVS